MSWTGDVKYHAGAHRAIENGREIRMVVSMPPNPSHLEAVDPVVVGMRAPQAPARMPRPASLRSGDVGARAHSRRCGVPGRASWPRR